MCRVLLGIQSDVARDYHVMIEDSNQNPFPIIHVPHILSSPHFEGGPFWSRARFV